MGGHAFTWSPLDLSLASRGLEACVYSVFGGGSVQPPLPTCLSLSLILSLSRIRSSVRQAWNQHYIRALITKLALLRFFYLHLYTRFVHTPRPFLCRPFTCVEFWTWVPMICLQRFYIYSKQYITWYFVPQSLPLMERIGPWDCWFRRSFSESCASPRPMYALS